MKKALALLVIMFVMVAQIGYCETADNGGVALLSSYPHRVLSGNEKEFIRQERARSVDGVFYYDIIKQDVDGGNYTNIEEYETNGEYARLKGTAFWGYVSDNGNSPLLEVYGENDIIYSKYFSKKDSTEITEIDIDISGYKTVRIELGNVASNGFYLSGMRFETESYNEEQNESN